MKKKGKPYKTDLPFLKNDITTFELELKFGIHSRNQRFEADDFKLKNSGI